MGKRWSVLVSWGALAVIVCAGTAAAQESGTTQFTATLTGAAEAPTPGEPDGKGTASVTLDEAKGEVCYNLEVSGLEGGATMAHIHKGAEGQAGGVVVKLEAPKNGSIRACAKADPSVIKEIAQNPSDYYVNVHDAKFPKGAIRGQLKPAA